MDAFILAVCRLGFAGLSPVMPGTCGSAFGCIARAFSLSSPPLMGEGRGSRPCFPGSGAWLPLAGN